MKLDQIYAEWESDAVVDRNNLDIESLKIPKLHSKYHQIYTNERLVLRKLEAELKQLKLDKYEFFTQGPSQETQQKGWKLPAAGKILKSEANTYVEADQDVIDLTLKIGLQVEKVDLLHSIIDTIQKRTFHIKNSIDFARWQSGM